MNPMIVGPVLELIRGGLDKLFPDKEKAAEAERELIKMMAEGDLQRTIKQLEINAVEAANPSVWVAGWRPWYGWIGGSGFGYELLLRPLLAWVSAIKGWPEPPPLNVDLLWCVTAGLLGLSTLRTVDKRGTKLPPRR